MHWTRDTHLLPDDRLCITVSRSNAKQPCAPRYLLVVIFLQTGELRELVNIVNQVSDKSLHILGDMHDRVKVVGDSLEGLMGAFQRIARATFFNTQLLLGLKIFEPRVAKSATVTAITPQSPVTEETLRLPRPLKEKAGLLQPRPDSDSLPQQASLDRPADGRA